MENRRTTRQNESKTRRVLRNSPSPSRKSPSRKSPARKSPARKSPGRKMPEQKSPRKRSPSPPVVDKKKIKPTKGAKEEDIKNNKAHVLLSPVKLDNIKKVPITRKKSDTKAKVLKTEDDTDTDEIVKITAKIVERAKQKLSGSRDYTPTLSEISNRSRHSASGSRSMSRSILDDDDRRSAEYSDQEDEEQNYKKIGKNYSSNKNTFNSSVQNAAQDMAWREFGGRFGALFSMILLAGVAFLLTFTCSSKTCGYDADHFAKLTKLETYFNLHVVGIYFAATWFVFIISTLPLLPRLIRLKTEHGVEEYRCNGTVTMFSALAVLSFLSYKEYPVYEFVREHFVQFCFTSIVYALLVSMYCYLRSMYVSSSSWNKYANSGNFLSDFFMGREIHPYWFNVIDIKMTHYRFAAVTAIFFNLICMNQTFSGFYVEEVNATTFAQKLSLSLQTVNENYAILGILVLQLLYFIDLLACESHLISSFELNAEGCGAWMFLRYAISPFLQSLTTFYFVEHRPEGAPKLVMLSMSATFVLALRLKRVSDYIKYNYLMNPNDPKYRCKYYLVVFNLNVN